ncbi:MAG: nucleotidyltransferase domain-containing protein [Candidatus Woesearchaeota archaeon]
MQKDNKKMEIMNLFFQHPTKQWHFSEIQKIAKIADNKVSKWLKVLCNENIIKKYKPTKKMPYYISCYDKPEYQNLKRIYALRNLHDSGLLNHLCSLKKPKAIILFGSFSRWDWHEKSDIDLFFYGDDDEFEKTDYEDKLGREIQIFSCKNKHEIKKYNKDLLYSIIKGDIIKGDINFIEVNANAKA